MSEQPGGALDEAAKLFDAMIRRVSGGDGRERHRDRDEDRDRDRDVWSRATAAEPRIATGAPECRDCPVCRAIAAGRESGGDVSRHLNEAGRSLLAAAQDVVAAFDRTRRDRPPEARGPEGSGRPRAGTSERAERPGTGDVWSDVTDGPADNG